MSVDGFEFFRQEVTAFARLGWVGLRLRWAEYLSVLFGTLFAYAAVLCIAGLVLLLLLALAVWGLSHFIGWVWALSVAAALLSAAGLWLYCMRRRLFRGLMVQALCQLFFAERDERKEEVDDEPKKSA